MKEIVVEKTRIDKWLWAVRIFKSRTLASDSCKENKVKVNGMEVKSSASVNIGDLVEVKKDGFNRKYKVLKIIEQRVSALLAAPCYEDLTPEEELRKYDAWFVGYLGKEVRDKGTGRPTKRDRREIDTFKESDLDFDNEHDDI
jgi:ribosome-associated heat shock protein Hsp15